MESSKVYVMLDSCFAGGSGRTDGVKSLLEGTRPGVLKVNDVALQYDNLKILQQQIKINWVTHIKKKDMDFLHIIFWKRCKKMEI